MFLQCLVMGWRHRCQSSCTMHNVCRPRGLEALASSEVCLVRLQEMICAFHFFIFRTLNTVPPSTSYIQPLETRVFDHQSTRKQYRVVLVILFNIGWWGFCDNVSTQPEPLQSLSLGLLTFIEGRCFCRLPVSTSSSWLLLGEKKCEKVKTFGWVISLITWIDRKDLVHTHPRRQRNSAL